jgi:hypothetical protein
MPALSISWWLMTSASAGTSFNVGIKNSEYRFDIVAIIGN